MGRITIRANGSATQPIRLKRQSINVESTYTSWPSFGGLTTNLSGARYAISTGGPLPAASANNVLSSNLSSLYAAYEGSTFSAGVEWTDDIGSSSATTFRGSPFISSSTLNNYSILEGTTNDGLSFPTGILPGGTGQSYTLFHVARYNGTERRIFTSGNSNWLSGFWNGNAGVAYHEGWLTAQTDYETTNWVISCDQAGLYRSNGVQRSTSIGGNRGTTLLTINNGGGAPGGGETSDWQVAEVVIFDSQLSATDIDYVEQYLGMKYQLPVNGTIPTSWPYGGTYGNVSGPTEDLNNVSKTLTSAVAPTYSFSDTFNVKSSLSRKFEKIITTTSEKIYTYNYLDQFDLQELRSLAGETRDYTKARAILSNVAVGGGGAPVDPESWE